MMKSIAIQRADAKTGDLVYYAVNAQGEGLFTRRDTDNGYRQIKGTMQYDASSPAQLIAQLTGGALQDGDIVTDDGGWDDDAARPDYPHTV